ncbi:MAG TPA: PorP/SprF family type IX secretion system membrane protein [Bacteroidia bacterium]|nr:PorP/SprF family type IX secretion system membrane protein [Bacteroidia bacterium]
MKKKFRYLSKIRKAKFVFAFCISHFAFYISSAQDIHFSQFNRSPLNLNPANTGFFDGDFRISGIHRNQWKSVTVPYKTFSGSFDMTTPFPNADNNLIGAGIVLNSDKAGDSEYGIFEGALSTSLIKNIGGDSVHFISGGIQLGFVQQSINYAKLTFDNQYNGDSFDPSLANGETFADDKFIYFDLSAGVNWLFRINERVNLGAGLSLFHINKPRLSFMDNGSSKLNRKVAFDVKSSIGLTEKIYLLPAVLYQNQYKYKELDFGSNVKFIVNKKPGKFIALYGGLWMRSKDAIFPSIGLDYNELNLGFSYDINTSDLKRASNNKGAYEISLTYIIKKVKRMVIHPPCPVY